MDSGSTVCIVPRYSGDPGYVDQLCNAAIRNLADSGVELDHAFVALVASIVYEMVGTNEATEILEEHLRGFGNEQLNNPRLIGIFIRLRIETEALRARNRICPRNVASYVSIVALSLESRLPELSDESVAYQCGRPFPAEDNRWGGDHSETISEVLFGLHELLSDFDTSKTTGGMKIEYWELNMQLISSKVYTVVPPKVVNALVVEMQLVRDLVLYSHDYLGAVQVAQAAVHQVLSHYLAIVRDCAPDLGDKAVCAGSDRANRLTATVPYLDAGKGDTVTFTGSTCFFLRSCDEAPDWGPFADVLAVYDVKHTMSLHNKPESALLSRSVVTAEAVRQSIEEHALKEGADGGQPASYDTQHPASTTDESCREHGQRPAYRDLVIPVLMTDLLALSLTILYYDSQGESQFVFFPPTYCRADIVAVLLFSLIATDQDWLGVACSQPASAGGATMAAGTTEQEPSVGASDQDELPVLPIGGGEGYGEQSRRKQSTGDQAACTFQAAPLLPADTLAALHRHRKENLDLTERGLEVVRKSQKTTLSAMDRFLKEL